MTVHLAMPEFILLGIIAITVVLNSIKTEKK